MHSVIQFLFIVVSQQPFLQHVQLLILDAIGKFWDQRLFEGSSYP